MSHAPGQILGLTAQSTGITTFDLPDGLSNALDVPALDELIEAHGVVLEHERAMRDPVGLTSIDDVRRPGVPAAHASNGMIYSHAGCFAAAMTGNSKDLRTAENGMVDGARASLTPARFYLGTTDYVYLHPGDRLFLREQPGVEATVLVTHQQLVESSGLRKDRLDYPVTRVQDVVDSAGVRFTKQDYTVCRGQLEWSGNRPQGPYVVRFLYRPHWYVNRLIHDLRFAQVDTADGRIVTRLPQNAEVLREYIYKNETPDPLGQGGPREMPAPAEGGTGPR